MKTRRTLIVSALALTLLAHLGALSVPCAMAESGVCVVESPVPASDVSAPDDATESNASDLVVEPAATPESSHGRSTAALPADASRETALDAPRALRERTGERTALSPSTPLFLRHCAFLC